MPNAPGDVFKLVQVSEVVPNGDQIVNVFQFRNILMPDTSDNGIMLDAQEILNTMWGTIEAFLGLTVRGIHVNVENESSATPIAQGPLAWAGTSTDDALPPTVACLGLWRTQVKRVQARKYIAGVVETAASGGAWTAPFLTAMSNFMVQWKAPAPLFTGNTYEGVVLSSSLVAPGYHTFTTQRVMSHNRTMRTRTIGRGA